MSALAAVLGRDVSRSLSPLLHLAAARDRSLPLEYRAVSCADEAAFRASVGELVAAGARGANVTIPFKGAAFALASERTAIAQEIGAVNCLVFEEASPTIIGDNTDGPALVAELLRLPPAVLARVQILGAGGAARAAAWALRACGAGEVIVSARRLAQARVVADLVGGTAQALVLSASPALPAPVPGITLVVSTLPPDPVLAATMIDQWTAGAQPPHILDLAYGTARISSPLVQAAEARAWPARDGLGMLVEQAALSFVRWWGGEVSRTRQAMWAALGRFDSHPAPE